MLGIVQKRTVSRHLETRLLAPVARSVHVHNLVQKERLQYPAILTEQRNYFIAYKHHFSCGTPRKIPSGQDSPSSQRRIWFILSKIVLLKRKMQMRIPEKVVSKTLPPLESPFAFSENMFREVVSDLSSCPLAELAIGYA